MALIRNRLAAATTVAAAFCLSANPAAAIELPRLGQSSQAERMDALDAANRHHGGRHHHDDDWDIDGDDILTGVLILGGLAAIAGIANSGRHRAEPYPEPQPQPDEAEYRAPARDDYRSGGMADAVDSCVAEVEAGRGPVGSVDRASRSGEGWYVAGALEGGAGFSCWVDGAGRVTDIEADGDDVGFEAHENDEAGGIALAPLHKQAIDGGLGENGGFEVAQAGE